MDRIYRGRKSAWIMDNLTSISSPMFLTTEQKVLAKGTNQPNYVTKRYKNRGFDGKIKNMSSQDLFYVLDTCRLTPGTKAMPLRTTPTCQLRAV